MKKISAYSLGLLLVASSAMAGVRDGGQKFRMDCRFYDAEQHYCVSSATYIAHCRDNSDGRGEDGGDGGQDGGQHGEPGKDCKKVDIVKVKYGVLCDRQTVFNNEGVAFSTTEPGSQVEDHIRPITSSVPKTVILWQGALLKEGTYDANLELSTHKITNGSCDITSRHFFFD